MLKKRLIKETETMLEDFGIKDRRKRLIIPADIKNESDLLRWRSKLIHKHLQKYCN